MTTKGTVRKAGSAKRPIWYFWTDHLHKVFVGEDQARELVLQGRTDLKRTR
jgi:hypothetical protein